MSCHTPYAFSGQFLRSDCVQFVVVAFNIIVVILSFKRQFHDSWMCWFEKFRMGFFFVDTIDTYIKNDIGIQQICCFFLLTAYNNKDHHLDGYFLVFVLVDACFGAVLMTLT
jgi:hypothetical protein